MDMSQARSSRQGHLMRVFLEGGVMSSRRWLIRRLPPGVMALGSLRFGGRSSTYRGHSAAKHETDLGNTAAQAADTESAGAEAVKTVMPQGVELFANRGQAGGVHQLRV